MKWRSRLTPAATAGSKPAASSRAAARSTPVLGTRFTTPPPWVEISASPATRPGRWRVARRATMPPMLCPTNTGWGLAAGKAAGTAAAAASTAAHASAASVATE